MGIWDRLAASARRGRGPMRFARPAWRGLMGFRLPVIRPVLAVMDGLYRGSSFAWWLAAKIFVREPLFRYRCERVGRRLVLERAIPQIIGSGRISIGDDVRIGTRNTWVVGFAWTKDAELVVGDRVSVNYQTTISVARSVRIGDDTMIAGNVQIYDNVSHPLSPARRLRHDGFSPEEAAPISIGHNVWIGTGALIMRGVSIGDNAVVAAASVVTHDVPPNTLVAGNPAVVVKTLPP